ncbi:MAG: response regulator [Chloroflexi bacterium]|nr:response regulator [Chloroflexota bacterium]
MAVRGTAILLVEDNPGDARLIQEYLSETAALRFTVTHAARLSEAFDQLATTPFDVVLLDLTLPDSSGIESVDGIVSKADGAAVVVLSGRDDDELVAAALHAGAQDYLSKSDVSPAALARAIRNAIERHAIVVERDAHARISRIISSTLDISTVMDDFVSQVRRLIPVDRLVITQIEQPAGTVSDMQIWGVIVPEWDENPAHPARGSGANWAIDNKRGHIGFPNSGPGPGGRYPGQVLSESAGLYSVMFAPLISNNEVIGTLNVKARDRDAYSDRELTLLEEIAHQIAGPIRAADLYDQALMWAQEREHRILLEAEKRELERVSESKSQFISTVSHELKTPLTSISAFIDILARNRANNLLDKQLAQLDIMRRNSQRLNMLINDLLDLSRIESGRFELQTEPFDARAMLNDLVVSFEPIISDKAQSLVVAGLDRPVWVRGDQARVAQVMSNLLSNACKYSGPGATIRLVARAAEEFVEFEVQDTGIGIAPGDIEQLFTMFFRADNVQTRAVPGTGLGLAIAKTIVDLHGGEMRVKSTVGEGTRIGFSIPGVMDAEEAAAELQLAAAPVVPKSRLEDISAESPSAGQPAA